MSSSVLIDERLIHRIHVREWGLPSLCMPGKMWRSKVHQTIHCMAWSAALWKYVQAWPASGSGYGPFLRISEEERNTLLRQLGQQLVESDEIGCVSIADNIGELAAFGYERMPSLVQGGAA